MTNTWNDNQPIYRQLRDRVVTMILDGTLKDGDTLPSVRSVAAEYRLNPMTVMKGYQELVDAELVEKKRGLGMFVMQGASEKLMLTERDKFLQEEWPGIHSRIERLGIDINDLIKNKLKTGGENS
jgi:GntR family transcriptional regulator